MSSNPGFVKPFGKIFSHGRSSRVEMLLSAKILEKDQKRLQSPLMRVEIRLPIQIG